MSKNLLKSLPELINAGIIDKNTATRIEKYYEEQKGTAQNRLIIIFGILGAILVGLGIILVIAHNWDSIPRLTKTLLVFIPLFAGQILCGYTLLKNRDSIVWTESSSIFLFLSIGATISLLSQIYVLGGSIPGFILTWMLLGLPIIYIMNSSVSSLFYISGITYYAVYIGYFHYPYADTWRYWILLLLVLPKYILSLRKNPDSNFITFHNWIIPLSVLIVFGSIAENYDRLMYVNYICLFGLFNILGNFKELDRARLITNGYRIIAAAGTIFIFFMLSFDWFWVEMHEMLDFDNMLGSVEFYIFVLLLVINIVTIAYQHYTHTISGISPHNWVFMIFVLIYFLGYFVPELSMVLINISLFALGIYSIWLGISSNHLGILNFGLIIITVLIICKFFESDISFFARGLIFIMVGAGFFATNFYLFKKRKNNEKLNQGTI